MTDPMTYNDFINHLDKLNILEAKTNVFCNNLLLINIKDVNKGYIEISTGTKDGRTYFHNNYDSAYEQIINLLFLGSKDIKFYMLYKDYTIPINTIINYTFIIDDQEYIWNNPDVIVDITDWLNNICNYTSINLPIDNSAHVPVVNTYKKHVEIIAYSSTYKDKATAIGVFPSNILFDESNSYIKFSFDCLTFNFNFMKDVVCGVK